jgi:hypothetical protein
MVVTHVIEKNSAAPKKRSLNSTNCGDESIPTYDNSIRKSGKWSEEEIMFAKHLIAAFENGNLKDCEDGSTLRAYLSKKLNCSPMRISKKFAGKCIGKVR